MLHRPTSTPAWSPLRWSGFRRIALTGPTSTLLRYVIIAAFLTALGCVYLWQVNSLSTLYENVGKVEAEAYALEQQNWSVAAQLAQWSSPSHVDRESVERGYVAAPQVNTVELLAATDPADAPGAGQ